MVLVHEYGHFIAAKKIGVTVEEFSIGFGPKILGWKRGGTEYKWCLLPLGGYVKMLGENPDEDVKGDPGEYQSRSRWERFIILIMGPVFNVLLAYLIWVAMLSGGEQKFQYLLDEPVVGHVTAGMPADDAGIQVGDRVLSVNGEEMETWEDLIFKVATSPRESLEFLIDREGQELVFTMQPVEGQARGGGSVGLAPYFPPKIADVDEGSPAEEAGIRPGDMIVSLNSNPVTSFQSMGEILAGYEGSMGSMTLVVEREGQRVDLSITPEFNEQTESYLIGITREPMAMAIVQYNFIESLGIAFERCVDMTVRLYQVVGKLFTGMLSTKAISGPIEIAAISGAAAQQGIMSLLGLMAFISLNLGIVNMLPLPVLDGGQILILGIEGAMRRDLSMKVKEWIMRVGIVLLLALMAFVIFQDIMKVVSGIM